MIQLYIEGRLADIDDEFSIQLEKDFDNYDEHVVEEAHYSFEVELPVTKNNREALGFVDVFDVANKFGRTYSAVLNVDEVNVLDGKFMLSEITGEYYSGNLYVPAKASLKDVLGDKKLKEIKEHPMYISSWGDIANINNGLIRQTTEDKHIAFPYILYRLPYNNGESSLPLTTQDLGASGNTFSVDNLFPAYNVLSILKDAFEGEGYKIQGNVFQIEKFTELYQTFSNSYNDFHDSKNTPYYCKFNIKYDLRKNDNTSSTALITDLYDDPSMRVGTDAILLSENSVITEQKDDYNMLVKGKNTDARSLIIPKTGWYRIHCNGSFNFPMNSGEWRQDERITVDGCYNDSDRVDLSQNIIEFQVKKTLEPMSNVQYYSMNCSTPMVPTNLSKDKIGYEEEKYGKDWWKTLIGVELSYDDSRNKFAKNGGTAIVKDYSGFDTSEFIAGARFGCPFVSDDYSNDNLYDRRSEELVFACLPNPAKATKKSYSDDGGVEHQYLTLYNPLYIKQSNSDSYRYDYGSQTAQVLVRDNSFSNFGGYNKFIPNLNSDGGTWDTTTNYNAISYPGQNNSTASVNSLTAGNWNINTCVWLEEGDLISLELVMPINDYADECGWAEFCDWKHFYKSGVIWTSCNVDFEIGIINSDEKWIPTANSPMPSFESIVTPVKTNVNQWLGDTKVNDYIENFLNTFNLRLTRVNSTTYSIDTLANDTLTEGNIINIDEWANVKDASFERIDAKSTKLEWTISTDEDGYVHGNYTKADPTKRDLSGYTGGVLFENESDTSDEERNIKSNWSYTWLRDISFVNGDVAFTGGTKEVPIISDTSIWENTYLSIQDADYQTDKTSRLIYLDRNPYTKMYNYFNIVGYRNDTTIPEVKAPLLFCKNYIQYYNTQNQMMTFRLDYDNELSTKDDKVITDVYFKIKRGYQYGVNIPVRLPNYIYQRIKSNTLVKFNDGLYRVLGIEGHDVTGKDEATLKLISL